MHQNYPISSVHLRVREYTFENWPRWAVVIVLFFNVLHTHTRTILEQRKNKHPIHEIFFRLCTWHVAVCIHTHHDSILIHRFSSVLLWMCVPIPNTEKTRLEFELEPGNDWANASHSRCIECKWMYSVTKFSIIYITADHHIYFAMKIRIFKRCVYVNCYSMAKHKKRIRNESNPFISTRIKIAAQQCGDDDFQLNHSVPSINGRHQCSFYACTLHNFQPNIPFSLIFVLH